MRAKKKESLLNKISVSRLPESPLVSCVQLCPTTPGEGALPHRGLRTEEPSGRRRETFSKKFSFGPTRAFSCLPLLKSPLLQCTESVTTIACRAWLQGCFLDSLKWIGLEYYRRLLGWNSLLWTHLHRALTPGGSSGHQSQ